MSLSDPNPAPPSDAGAAGDAFNHDNSTPPLEQVARFLRILFRLGDVFEVRAPKCADGPNGKYVSTYSGYFTYASIDKAAADIAALDASGIAPGIYVTLNPVCSDLLARAANRLKAKSNDATKDTEIVWRRWGLFDFDPVRATGVSSTNAELAAAQARAMAVAAALRAAGWPEPIIGLSGNGGHLLYAIDLPTADGGLVERVLAGLAEQFDDEAVKLDRSVFNPSRITKVFGTMARKGDPVVGIAGVEDRPHRRATLLSVPSEIQPVPRELLEAVASATPTPSVAPVRNTVTQKIANSASTFERFDHTPEGVTAYIERHGVRVTGTRTKGTMTWLDLDRCPVVPDCASTGGSDISVGVCIDGTIVYKNQHNRGQGLKWVNVREALEPGYEAWSLGWSGGKRDSTSSVASVGPDSVGVPDSWPEPLPLPDALPPVMAFDAELLPHGFRRWITDIADRVQCPIDFPAVTVMVAAGGIVGRRLGVRPKRQDDWLVVPNLWGAGIGRPGVMKTPAIQEPLKPVKWLEIAAKEEYEAAVAEAEAAKLVGGLRKKDAEREIRKQLKNPDEAHRLARESIADAAAEPARKRYLVNDSTVEKLGEILNQNPSGVIVYRDELIGLLKSLDKEGQEGARSFFLEAWNGTGRYTFDRIGRGTIDIEAATVSIIGGIQPGPLGQYLRAAAKGGVGDDGLMQRFQLLVWPDISREWVNVDRWPDSEARKQAREIFEGLCGLEPILLGADTDPIEPGGIPFLRFTPDAQGEFDSWREGLEGIIRSSELHPAMESHLSKYRSLIPSLALLIHLADGQSGAVGVEPLERAIRWGIYLRSHAQRVYSQAIHPDIAAARTLATRLLAEDVNDRFALRDIYRKGWSGLTTPDQAEGAVDVLISLGWLRENRHPTLGRTGTVYLINPRLGAQNGPKKLGPPEEGTDKADRSPPSGSSVGADPEEPQKNEGDWGVA